MATRDRASILAHLEKVERHVIQGERHLARQREIVDELERNFHDSSVTRELLRLFEELQVLHVAHRDRLRKELVAHEVIESDQAP